MLSLSFVIPIVKAPAALDRSRRTIKDLDVITTIASVQIKTALSDVLRALDKVNLVDQRGYGIFLQTFALKIYDEKRNERHPHHFLEFYVTDAEAGFHALSTRLLKASLAEYARFVMRQRANIIKYFLRTSSTGRTQTMCARL